MRCKKHLPDVTSTIGVCASCLRERLKPLLAAQAQAQAQSERVANSDHHCCRKTKTDPEDSPNPPPPPLNFPRSVSPYVARRKSDCDRDRHREKLFYGTPQVNAAVCGGGGGGGGASEKRRHGGRFWILSNLFRARSNKAEASHVESCEEPSPPPPSWFSTILPARRHSHNHNHGGIDKRRCRNSDRGLSPAVAENFSDEADPAKDRTDSGNSSESSPGKQNPTAEAAAAANRRSRLGPTGKGLTGMAFCLSPLVRASPNRHWTQKGLAQEFGGGGAHHISNASSFCANRSRKLADFGRGAHNR
ncbi:hypothetical protein VNO78_26239 [Psophocarpus tetragonolobus]|uniref:Uncharacterized protein n=1 Tax=Psophocarpus tetragonolobus TaxID=3891 RepID=A0AAN9RZ88_PSOTE